MDRPRARLSNSSPKARRLIAPSRGSRRFGLLALGVLASLGDLACDDHSSTGRGIGPLEVSIGPQGFAPTTTFELSANASIAHPGPAPTFSFRWEVDGVDAGNTTRIVPASATRKHQIWKVTVFADFGSERVGPTTAEILVVNARPQIIDFVGIIPTSANDCGSGSTTFSVTPSPVATFDDDTSESGDTVSVSTQWFVNGAPVVGATMSTYSAVFTAGDEVTFRLTPNDGEEDGPIRGPFPASVIISACPMPATLSGLVSGPPASLARASRRAGTRGGAAVVTAPAPLASPISISELNVCNIAVDGSLECTGVEEFGLTNPPAGAYSQVAVAHDYACAIRADDLGIQCWGAPPPDSGLLAPPEGPFVQLGLGIDAACGLRVTGEVACWGAGSTGAEVPPEGLFVYLDVSDSYRCAITADGLVSCWGE